MKRASSLAFLLLAGATLAAAPALAKPSIQTGKNICTAEAKKQTPAPKSVRVVDTDTRVTSDALVYTLKTKNADDSASRLTCTVSVTTSAATLAPAE
jgi:hypothetical protein